MVLIWGARFDLVVPGDVVEAEPAHHGDAADVSLRDGVQTLGLSRQRPPPPFALGASNAYLLGEHPTCSV